MQKKITMTEEELRSRDFIRVETIITDRGEIDRFIQDGSDVEMLIEIRPDLKAKNDLLSFHAMTLQRVGGGVLRIAETNTRDLDKESAEVIAWEMIDGDDLVIEYMEGRAPSTLPDGTRAPKGHIIERDDRNTPEMAGPG